MLDWADGDMNLVKQCAETVLRVAKQILTDLTPGSAAEPDSDELAEPAEDGAGLLVALADAGPVPR